MYGSSYNGDALFAGTRTNRKSFTHHDDEDDGNENGHEDFCDEPTSKKRRPTESLDED